MKLTSKHFIWIGVTCLMAMTALYSRKQIVGVNAKQDALPIEIEHPCEKFLAIPELKISDKENNMARENTETSTQDFETIYTTGYITDETTDSPRTETTSDVETRTYSSKNLTFVEPTSMRNESYDRKIAERFAARYNRMYKDCPRTEPEPGPFKPNTNILVNLNHGLEVCVIGKGGSSSWHHLIWQLRRHDSGKSYDLHEYRLRHTYFNYKTSKFAQDSELLSTWTRGVDDNFFTEPNPQKMHRIFAGRHPFARLISGWNQKTMRRTDKDEMHFIKTNPKMRQFRGVEPDADHVMSWEDWARYVSVHRKRHFHEDYHFSVATQACKPCHYFYTYIVKLETLSEDYDWIMRRLNLTGDIKLGSSGSPKAGSKVNYNPGLSIQKYMRRLPANVVQDLYDLYKPEFDRFGYTFDFDTYMGGGFD